MITSALSMLHQLFWHCPDTARPEARTAGAPVRLAGLLESNSRLQEPKWIAVCGDAIRMLAYEDPPTKVGYTSTIEAYLVMLSGGPVILIAVDYVTVRVGFHSPTMLSAHLFFVQLQSEWRPTMKMLSHGRRKPIVLRPGTIAISFIHC
ncbi:unnamed protein product [Protopolystoma xenopodis]|uniref:Uncharacterized protein n=1 Tax=Protopolystoma xenopodis TaxID=117903 RepID=A0A448XGT0_9PLAT|nr:unnamed protein product [Protopolystoma xenopodis]